MKSLSFVAVGLFSFCQVSQAQTHDPIFLHPDFSESVFGKINNIKTLDHAVYALSYTHTHDNRTSTLDIIVADQNHNKFIDFSEIENITVSQKTETSDPVYHVALLSYSDSRIIQIAQNKTETLYFTQDAEKAKSHIENMIDVLFPAKEHHDTDQMFHLCSLPQ
jgi:hypothetical protein